MVRNYSIVCLGIEGVALRVPDILLAQPSRGVAAEMFSQSQPHEEFKIKKLHERLFLPHMYFSRAIHRLSSFIKHHAAARNASQHLEGRLSGVVDRGEG